MPRWNVTVFTYDRAKPWLIVDQHAATVEAPSRPGAEIAAKVGLQDNQRAAIEDQVPEDAGADGTLDT